MRQIFTNVVLIMALMLPLGIPEPVQAQNGFLNNLFSGGQRGRDRRAAAAARRVEARELQSALNFFGFDAGLIDGIIGTRSRIAIRSYQAALGLPLTGTLDEAQTLFLLSAYRKISSDSPEMRRQIAASSEGALGVLKSIYFETPLIEAPIINPIINIDSMRVFCTNIGASGPQELVTAQFCNLRQLAMAQSDEVLETAPNPQSLAQVFEKCEGFATEITPYTTRLASTETAAFLAEMADWAASTNTPPAALTRIAQTCLGVGYRRDNADLALASLAALSGLNRSEYIELTGYHIAFGLGLSGAQNPALASTWLESAVAALPEGNVGLTGQKSSARAEIIVDILNILTANE